jgi:putative ABC transport system permease protein
MRSRRTLVIVQIACSVVLLVACDLLLATFFKLNGQPLGFQPSDSYVLGLSLPRRHYRSEEQIEHFTDELLPRLRGLPGVRSAAMTLWFHLADAGWSPFRVESQAAANPNHLPQAVQEIVSPGYFEAMGIPILNGRGFSESDRKDTVPVAILNQEAVDRYFGGRSPLGEHVRIGDANNPTDPLLLKGRWLEIIGVAGSTKSVPYNQLAWQTRPAIYTAYGQQPLVGLKGSNTDYTPLTFIVRTVHGVGLSADSVRQAVWKTDANLPVGRIRSLGEMVAALQAQPRVRARLLTLFSSLTLLLAAIGIYGVVAQSVTQRFREIGVRMALGADRGNVARLVLREAALLAGTGIACGCLLAFFIVRLLRGLLYEIAPGNPIAYSLVAVVVLAVALLASLFPATRAASIDPVDALRSE